LLDGLHEDLNRILAKPTTQTTPEREAELERLPPHIASEQEWEMYRSRNDSIIVDFFQGQFRNRLECLTCHTVRLCIVYIHFLDVDSFHVKTSTTYNAFMYLSLPIPTPNRGSKVSLQSCLDALVNKEVIEKSDAW
jgi:ubiquitin carboxyl-terminal hydrolase 8